MSLTDLIVDIWYWKSPKSPKNATFADDDALKSISQDGCVTLDEWKLCLDSCTMHHSTFVDWILDNVQKVNMILKGSCNTGVTKSSTKGYYGVVEVWLNKKDTANFLSILHLKKKDML